MPTDVEGSLFPSARTTAVDWVNVEIEFALAEILNPLIRCDVKVAFGTAYEPVNHQKPNMKIVSFSSFVCYFTGFTIVQVYFYNFRPTLFRIKNIFSKKTYFRRQKGVME